MWDNTRLRFKRILCPIDLSADSHRGLRDAVALAASYRARLFVLHCTAPETNTMVAARAELTNIVERIAGEYVRSSGMPEIDWESVIVSGEPGVEIAREAAEREAHLIVMRSRRRPYAAALLGSVAESVSRMAPCPTLVTHAREFEGGVRTSNSLDLKRVLVAYDFSSDSELALSYGLSFAQQYRAELHVLHVVPSRPKQSIPHISLRSMASETAFSKAFAALKTAAPYNEAGESIRHAVREGQPYREILAYAEDQAVEMICMGASGTGFGMRALFGSNADRVLRQAECPILIARPLRPAVSAPANFSLRTTSGTAFAHETMEGIEK